MSRPNSAETIAAIRKATGWTQTQLAHLLAVSNAQISAIENGKKNLSKRLVELLIYKVNVRREWIEEGKGEPFDETNPPPKPVLSRGAKAIATAAVLSPFTPAVSAAIAIGIGASEIVKKLIDAYDVKNATELAHKILNTGQSTVASWIRRDKVPEGVIAEAINKTDLTLEELLSNEDYIYIKKIDLVETIKRMSLSGDLKTMKPSEISTLFDNISSTK